MNPDSLSFAASRVDLFDRDSVESCAVKIVTNTGKAIYLLCAYVPPQQESQLLQLCNSIQQANVDNLVLMGDLNGKSQEWNNSTSDRHGDLIEDMLAINRLIIHNDGQPTRRGGQSVIDLIITSAGIGTLVKDCSTLTHESVRSDHIAILSDFDIDVQESMAQTKEVRQLRKVNWNDWRERTETDFSRWMLQDFECFDEAYEDFSNTLTSAYNDVIPVKTIKIRNRQKRPCWWNEHVKSAKKSLNHFQRKFKKRNTVQNKLDLITAEEGFAKAKEDAQESWTGELLDKFDNTRNPREMWDVYKKMTKKDQSKSVLPLIQEDSEPVFDPTDKCKLLQEAFFDCHQHQTNQFDEEFYAKVMGEYSDITSELNSEQLEGEEIYNRNITLEEVEGAIARLKPGKSPGPDMFPTDLFIQAGDTLRSALHRLLSMSWKEGKLPEIWKSADVKFLRKAGKTNYYSPNSYRPISLTSCVVKILERIITDRLEAHIEGSRIIDAEQDGFRKKHSTINAVLRLVQSIYNGFEKDLYTAAVFIDLKGAYDTIWREGLIYKLNSIGICGRLLKWISNFLNSRRARCILEQTSGPGFETTIGLPQGSVLSPILFNIYTIDMYRKLLGAHIKYADDGTVWATERTIEMAVAQACRIALSVKQFCHLWRLIISLIKTDGTLFSKFKIQEKPQFKLGECVLNYNPMPKLLGITLDEQLSFDTHIQNVTKKASSSLKIIREVKGISRVSTCKLLRLYVTVVRPILEYGSVIWQGSKHVNRLSTVQRKALCLCLGLPGTAGTETVEVVSGIPPLDIYFRQTSVRELAKIQAKSIRQPIKILLNNMTETEKTQEDISRPAISPVRLALTYASEMEKETGVNIQFMEEEPEYEPGSIGMSASAPQYWSRLGSSKSSSSDQQEQGRELILDMMMEAPEGTTFAFTDGSCLTNPGPCGAGAVIYQDHHQPVCLKRPVSRRGSILLGELVAILITLEFMVQHITSMGCSLLKIFSDSQSTVGILTLNWKDTSYRSITKDIRNAIRTLTDAGITVDINWAPGHSSIAGNEEADRLAKEAAQEASTFKEGSGSTSMADVKIASHTYTMTLWQRRWNIAEVGREYYKYYPSITAQRHFDLPTKQSYSRIIQLQTGYSVLNQYRFKLGQTESSLCQCGQVEDTEHYLLQCPLQEEPRNILARNLGQKLGLYHLDTKELLGSSNHENIPEYRETIRRELADFIEATGRFSPNKASPTLSP